MPRRTILLVCVIPFLPGCGQRAEAARAEAEQALAAAQQRAAALAAEAAKLAAATWSDLGGSLGGLTGGASARAAKADLTVLVERLQAQAAALGGADQLAAAMGRDAVASVRERVAALLADAEVAKAIGPVLEQLRALVAN